MGGDLLNGSSLQKILGERLDKPSISIEALEKWIHGFTSEKCDAVWIVHDHTCTNQTPTSWLFQCSPVPVGFRCARARASLDEYSLPSRGSGQSTWSIGAGS